MGLFWKNYNTPGKGVSKNEPEKRGFFRFFELFFRNFWTLFSCEMLYLLLSIPVLTSGLANVGMTYVCRMASKDKHIFPVSDFFDAIKKNWKRALSLGIINTVVTLILAADLYVLYVYTSQGIMSNLWGGIVFVASMFFFVAYSFAQFYQYTLMITFDFKLKDIIKNSWLFATLGIKHNLIIGATLVAIYFVAWVLICNFGIGLWIVSIIGLFIFPIFRFMLIQFNVFPEIKKYIIDPYYAEHPDEDIEKRRQLGLINTNEDAVFDDNVPEGSD